MKRRRKEETIAPAFLPRGGMESLTPYLGKWVAMDQEGQVQAAGETFSEAARGATVRSVKNPVFAYVSASGFIG
jgi:hypothetical protein